MSTSDKEIVEWLRQPQKNDEGSHLKLPKDYEVESIDQPKPGRYEQEEGTSKNFNAFEPQQMDSVNHNQVSMNYARVSAEGLKSREYEQEVMRVADAETKNYNPYEPQDTNGARRHQSSVGSSKNPIENTIPDDLNRNNRRKTVDLTSPKDSTYDITKAEDAPKENYFTIQHGNRRFDTVMTQGLGSNPYDRASQRNDPALGSEYVSFPQEASIGDTTERFWDYVPVDNSLFPSQDNAKVSFYGQPASASKAAVSRPDRKVAQKSVLTEQSPASKQQPDILHPDTTVDEVFQKLRQLDFGLQRSDTKTGNAVSRTSNQEQHLSSRTRVLQPDGKYFMS